MSKEKLDFLRLLITIFGFFFGGWWTNFLSDIFNSSNVPTPNKCFVILHIAVIFMSFYLAAYIEKWKHLLGVFVLFDALIASTMFSYLSPHPLIPGEPFIWKLFMAMFSLAILQFLIIQYVRARLSRSECETTNDSTVGKPLVV